MGTRNVPEPSWRVWNGTLGFWFTFLGKAFLQGHGSPRTSCWLASSPWFKDQLTEGRGQEIPYYFKCGLLDHLRLKEIHVGVSAQYLSPHPTPRSAMDSQGWIPNGDNPGTSHLTGHTQLHQGVACKRQCTGHPRTPVSTSYNACRFLHYLAHPWVWNLFFQWVPTDFQMPACFFPDL